MTVVVPVIACGALSGFVVGLIHIGFALTDPSPRNIWDWYVVAMGFGMAAMVVPTLRYLIGLQ